MNLRPALMLFHAVLALLVVCNVALADQDIEIRFVRDATSGQEVLKAQTAFESHGSALRNVLLNFHGYADLHPWITEATVVAHPINGRAEFIIRFKFPWPIGKRWSHIEVSRDNNAIIWRQIEGTMKANRGQLVFVSNGQSTRIDYSATIGVGFPDAWTRGFKKQFVTEFIDAAYARATKTNTTGLRLATSSPN